MSARWRSATRDFSFGFLGDERLFARPLEGETVRSLLESAQQDDENALVCAHSVNLAEVYYHVLGETGDESLAEAAIVSASPQELLCSGPFGARVLAR